MNYREPRTLVLIIPIVLIITLLAIPNIVIALHATPDGLLQKWIDKDTVLIPSIALIGCILYSFWVLRGDIKGFALKKRAAALGISVLAGISLLYLVLRWGTFWEIKAAYSELLKLGPASVIVLSLPTAFCLWFFRTYDVKKQIEQQRETLLNDAVALLFNENDIKARPAGLVLIAQLRQSNEDDENFRDRIDCITKMGLNLLRAKLRAANLEGLNLNEANLDGATLDDANLKGVSLEGAKLEGADLINTNLSGAHLKMVNQIIKADFKIANIEGTELPFRDKEEAMQVVRNFDQAVGEPIYLDREEHE